MSPLRNHKPADIKVEMPEVRLPDIRLPDIHLPSDRVNTILRALTVLLLLLLFLHAHGWAQGIKPTDQKTLTPCNILSAASTNSTNCKAAPGNLVSYEVFNTTTTIYYLRLYNTASAPTCSSATGFIRSIPIKPADAAGNLGGIIRGSEPVNYSIGISFCLTGGSSSTDNTNAATGIFGEIRTQ